MLNIRILFALLLMFAFHALYGQQNRAGRSRSGSGAGRTESNPARKTETLIPPGVYVGSYACRDQAAQVRIDVEPAREGVYFGFIRFYPAYGDKDNMTGAYRFQASAIHHTAGMPVLLTRWLTSKGEKFTHNIYRPGTWTQYTSAPAKWQINNSVFSYDPASKSLTWHFSYPKCADIVLIFDQQQSNAFRLYVNGQEKNPGRKITYPQASNSGERAAILAEWTGKIALEYPEMNPNKTEVGKLYRIAYNLFADEYFTPYFGKRFDELSDRERKQIGSSMRKAFTDDALGYLFSWEKGNLERAFLNETGSFNYHEVANAVVVQRNKRKKYSEIMKRLNTDMPTVYAGDIDGFRKFLNNEGPGLWPSELEQLKQGIESARLNASENTLTQKVDELLASYPGKDVESATGLMNAYNRNSGLFSNVGYEKRSTEEQRIFDRIDIVLRPLLEDEKRKLEQIVTDANALQNVNAWFAGFNGKYGQFNQSPLYKSLIDIMLRKKWTAIEKNYTGVEKRINSAMLPELNHLEKEILTPDAGSTQYAAPAKKIQNLIDNRKAALKEQEVLQKQKAEADLWASIEREQTSTGEPTEQQMMLALNKSYLVTNAKMENLSRTKVNKEDPMSAVFALLGMGLKDTKIYVKSVRKIACEKAVGKPGFNCDCTVELNLSGGLAGVAYGPWLKYMDDNIVTHRFAKSADYGWYFISGEK